MGDSGIRRVINLIAAVAHVRGLVEFSDQLTWGSRPRLYAHACYRRLIWVAALPLHVISWIVLFHS
jgi:hypothetical protein